ncbi:ganglioside-induced differentiation-associated protein 2 [Ciona intestinalis]
MDVHSSDFVERSSHITLNQLQNWSKLYINDDNFTDDDENVPDFRFDVRHDLNDRIYLCSDDLSKLEVDAVVLPINDVNLHKSQLAKDVTLGAGPEISAVYERYKLNKDMKTGSVAFETGFALPARFVISVMEPRISLKYQTAVETALHGCYVGAMQCAAEQKLSSVAFPLLYDPTAEPSLTTHMGHIAIRTIRCCLQKLSCHPKAVVLVLTEKQMDLYSNLLSTYFPRSNAEASDFIYWLPQTEFTDWGEIVRADRAIRISDFATESQATPEMPESSHKEDDPVIPSTITSHSFASMSGDHDSRRKRQIENMTKDKMLKSQERIYHRLLRCARTENLSEIASTKALYVCGNDRGGSPVVVLVAKYMNVQNMNMDKALLYFIHILDSVVNERYSLVYFHTVSESKNHPSVEFIRHVYHTLDQRYRENLKYLYIVHPSFMSKIFVWLFSTFSASDVKGQVLSIKNIPQLYQFISSDQIDIPPFVVDYDLEANASTYNSSTSKMSTASNRKL